MTTMVNENKNKKPLVTLDAANPAPDSVVETEQIGAGWAGNQSATVSPSTGTTQNDGTKTLSYDQVKEFEKTGTVSGRDPNNSNVGPGGVNMKMELPASATKYGVLRGAPSSVVLQHMIDAIPVETEEQRKRRERAEKRNALFAAIGDGMSALSNLYFTTKGSPSADQSKSLSKAESERKDKARKERESNIERRLRLLKEQRAELNNIESQRLKERQLEIMEKYREGLVKAANNRVDELRRNNTAEGVRKREKDQADKKRQDKEADNRNKNRDRNAATNAAKAGEQRRHHQETEKNQKNKSGNKKKTNVEWQ